MSTFNRYQRVIINRPHPTIVAGAEVVQAKTSEFDPMKDLYYLGDTPNGLPVAVGFEEQDNGLRKRIWVILHAVERDEKQNVYRVCTYPVIYFDGVYMDRVLAKLLDSQSVNTIHELIGYVEGIDWRSHRNDHTIQLVSCLDTNKVSISIDPSDEWKRYAV